MLPTWQDGASSLILLAAAHETGLLDTLTAALPIRTPTTPPRLLHMLAVTIRALMLTLLFLSAVGLRRTWDLRGYTGTALALITGRLWAYGYRHVECFLAEVARAGGAAPLTDALAGWTTHLWRTASLESDSMTVTVYIDGHRKAVRVSRQSALGTCEMRFILRCMAFQRHATDSNLVSNVPGGL